MESGDLPSPVSGPEVSASRMWRRSILHRLHKGAFRYLELYRPLRLSLKLSTLNKKTVKGKSLHTAQQTTTTHESSGKKSRRNSKAQLSFAPVHVDQPRPGIESDVLGRTNPGLLLGPGLTQGTLSEAYISPPRESEIRTPSSQASP